MNRTAFLIALLLALLPLLVACPGGTNPMPPAPPSPAPPTPPTPPSPPPPPAGPLVTPVGTVKGEKVSKTIGPEGGIIETSDGSFALNIPAGALAAPTELSLQPVTNPIAFGLGLGVKLGPADLTFAIPITLRFTLDEEATDSPEVLGLAFQDSDGKWVQLVQEPVVSQGATAQAGIAPLAGKIIEFKVRKPKRAAALIKRYTLEPSSAIINVGQSLDLTLMEIPPTPPSPPCDPNDDCLSPLPPAPRPATSGGCCPAATAGTLRLKSGAVYTYTAPNQRPTPNPVTASVKAGTGKVSSSIYIADSGHWVGKLKFSYKGTFSEDFSLPPGTDCGQNYKTCSHTHTMDSARSASGTVLYAGPDLGQGGGASLPGVMASGSAEESAYDYLLKTGTRPSGCNEKTEQSRNLSAKGTHGGPPGPGVAALIGFRPDGTYLLMLTRSPIPIKGSEVEKSYSFDCVSGEHKPPPTTRAVDTLDQGNATFFDLSGPLDPQNPNRIVGQKNFSEKTVGGMELDYTLQWEFTRP